MDERHRCARGNACEDAERIIELPGGNRVWVGAPVHDMARQFCPTCLRYLRYAIDALPLDIAELTTRVIPSMEIHYRDPTVPDQPRVKLHSPVPIVLDAEALRALVDQEVTAWAKSTADEAGVDWSLGMAAASRQGARVQAGCQLLADRLDHFLGLPPQRHRVRSSGISPLDGWSEWDLARMVFDDDGAWWIDRNGTEGALVMFDLHEQVIAYVGRATADRSPLPCPSCERTALVREHRNRKVICRCCWDEMTDDAYERYIDVTSDHYGITR